MLCLSVAIRLASIVTVGSSDGILLDTPSPHYVVELHESIAAFTQYVAPSADLEPIEKARQKKRLLASGEKMEMTAITGQKYVCVIPDPESADKGSNTVGVDGTTVVEGGIHEEEDAEAKALRLEIELFKARLLPLAGNCHTKTMGYWAYEICLMGSIRQFHREGKKIGMEFKLGAYDSELDHVLDDDEVLPEEQKATSPSTRPARKAGDASKAKAPAEPPVFAQTYVNGDASRKTVVKFTCGKKSEFVSIEEKPTHTYTATFASPSVCGVRDNTFSLLAPLRKRCIKKVDAWWTYEFCAGKNIRQFRKEEGRTTVEHILGKFDAVVNRHLRRQQAQALRTWNATIAGGNAQKTFEEVYDGGSRCDLTGKPRSATVQYRCAKTERHAVLESVVEDATCGYTAVVATPLLCSHPAFQPSAADQTVRIHCVPQRELEATV